MRAGLAMYFVTLEDEALMEVADRIVVELEIEHFFNIQLVGDYVIEVNPRISTVVYQEDLNIPAPSGVKRALGEISAEELVALRLADPPGGRHSATSTSSSGMPDACGDRPDARPLLPHPEPHPPGATGTCHAGCHMSVALSCRVGAGFSTDELPPRAPAHPQS